MAFRQRVKSFVGMVLRGINFPNWGIPLPGQADLYQYATQGAADSRERKVAIGSAIRLITNTGSTMPWDAMRGAGNSTTTVTPTPVILLNPDASGRGSRDWRAQVFYSLAARGNAVCHITTRDPLTGLPTTLVPIHPDTIKPRQLTGAPLMNGVTPTTYEWVLNSGKTLQPDEVLHIRLFPVPGEIWGRSPIEQHAATIGLSINAERFGDDWFTSGGHPNALLTSKDPLTDEQATRTKNKFKAAARNGEPVILPDGIGYTAIQITPEESQFLDTQRYTSAECARIFGPGMAEVLGYDTAGAMTYQNVADRDLHLLKYVLDTYFTALEEAMTGCLVRGQYVKMNRNSLLRMNPLARAQVYQIMTLIGAYTPNDILALEDMPAVPWGDKPYPITKLTETEAIGGPAPAPTTGSAGA